MLKFRLSVLAPAILSLAAICAPAVAGGNAFTANAEQSAANSTAQQGRVFVADEGMRFETGTGQRQIVQIVVPTLKVTRVLFPVDKVYVEIQGVAPMPTDRPASPCQKGTNVICEKVGMEKLGAFEVEKWRFATNGAPTATLMWWSPTRKMMLREEFPDGRVIQTTQSGVEDYEGRRVERWNTSYMLSNGQEYHSVQLFDAKLGVAVHETRPDGTTRRLYDIREVAADPAWFDVPKGYQEVEQPQSVAPAADREKQRR